MAIPRTIHQIWLQGARQVPVRYRDWIGRWKQLHPEWQYRLWDDDAIRQLLTDRFPWFLPTYRRYRLLHQRVDSARYFILYEHGGFYADVDTEPLKPLDELLATMPRVDMILSEQPFSAIERRLLRPLVGARRIITNAVMASDRHHPAWRELMQRLPKSRRRFFFLRELNITYSTGPALVSKALDPYIRQSSKIVVLPHHYFEAHFGFDPAFTEDGAGPGDHDRYVAHMQDATWHSPILKSTIHSYFMIKNLLRPRSSENPVIGGSHRNPHSAQE